MVMSALGGAIACAALFIIFGCTGLLKAGALKSVLSAVFLIGACVCAYAWYRMDRMYKAFSYDGDRQLSRKIIEAIAEHIELPEGGRGLDVGCGSGALTIACAKRCPQGSFVGIDRWGKEYASYNKPLCESNARAEGVSNVEFMRGDAVKLDFPDESFDAVTSNYVYHNIPGADHQALLLETLRLLKKGGVFAIHDIILSSNYGDMDAFVGKLRSMGYEKVELIDTTDGTFLSAKEAKQLSLAGSKLLYGKK